MKSAWDGLTPFVVVLVLVVAIALAPLVFRRGAVGAATLWSSLTEVAIRK
jgi:hypothetical protein